MTPRTMERWIKLYPKILNWEWYNNTNVKVLFFHCLLKANFQERKWNGFIIERGQFVTSIATLSKELGLTPMQIRAAIQKLQGTGEITIKTTNKFTIITICEYASYQDISIEQQQANEQSDNKQTTNKQQTNNNNNRIIDNIDSIDRKENTTTKVGSVKKKRTTELDFKSMLLQRGALEQNVIDWLSIRKNRGVPNNQSAVNGFFSEVEKAGISVADAVLYVARNGYKNFESNLYLKTNKNGQQRTKRDEAPVSDWNNVSQSELKF